MVAGNLHNSLLTCRNRSRRSASLGVHERPKLTMREHLRFPPRTKKGWRKWLASNRRAAIALRERLIFPRVLRIDRYNPFPNNKLIHCKSFTDSLHPRMLMSHKSLARKAIERGTPAGIRATNRLKVGVSRHDLHLIGVSTFGFLTRGHP
jgi:hypothetical protein